MLVPALSGCIPAAPLCARIRAAAPCRAGKGHFSEERATSMEEIQGAFISAIVPPATAAETAWWFGFVHDQLVVLEVAEGARVPVGPDPATLGLAAKSRHYLGALDGCDCYALDLDDAAPLPAGYTSQGLRGLYSRLPEDHFLLAGRAVQIVEWDRTHRFCGRCGTPTVALPGERAKQCPACGLASYPRLAPAVIVRVTRGDEILLARNNRFPRAFFSVVAGFVEPGESLEMTVRRELREEVAIEVTNLRYFGSQSWPFPHSLMLGFTADYASGEICVDGQELAEAGWFTSEALPNIPGKPSIARALIDDFLARGLPVAGRGGQLPPPR
jgi:NAD+ diphosphatase